MKLSCGVCNDDYDCQDIRFIADSKSRCKRKLKKYLSKVRRQDGKKDITERRKEI